MLQRFRVQTLFMTLPLGSGNHISTDANIIKVAKILINSFFIPHQLSALLRAYWIRPLPAQRPQISAERTPSVIYLIRVASHSSALKSVRCTKDINHPHGPVPILSPDALSLSFKYSLFRFVPLWASVTVAPPARQPETGCLVLRPSRRSSRRFAAPLSGC
jgi:hypothetical protein